MKIAVIGGGSSYTPELVKGFLERRDSFPLTELWLMDIDARRLDIVGNFARRMVAAHGDPFAVHLTTDRREALTGAMYVITQLRVGGIPARREDEYLGKRHGLIGQETTGVGGMSKALRTIPVILDIAHEMEKVAPDGLLINFTNPAGLVTQALSQYGGSVQAVGVCNVPITTKMVILDLLKRRAGFQNISPDQTRLDTLGLNHLSWHRGFWVGDENVWPLVMAYYLDELRHSDSPEWDVRTLEVLGMIPNYYLQYYYYTEKKLKEQERWPPSRAEEVMVIEQALFDRYQDPHLTDVPPELMKRGGAYYSTMAIELMEAHYHDTGAVHVVNVPHKGAVAGWPEDWVLEMPARVRRAGIEPLPTDPLPPVCFGLLAQVKCYELLTVEAAVHGDRNAAYQALLVHPLGPSADKVQEVLDDMLETHRQYLPQFWT